MEERRVRWDLDRLTNGEYAALRRAAGTVDLDVAAWRAFYKVDFQGESGMNERFAALCMSCLWRREDEVEILPMEECLRNFCVEGPDGGMELPGGLGKRVEALLETSWSSRDDYVLGKLMNLVKIIRSDGRFKPDFEALAEDLRRWNRESRAVQRRWLRVIYQRRAEASKGEEENENDA